jgi:CO/xanthine dehydrogenase FAD-binding subunit
MSSTPDSFAVERLSANPFGLNLPRMPVEPPVSSPTTLPDAYALLADGDGWRPVAGGTDLMVQITGEIGPPPERVLDIWRLDELRGISLDPHDGALRLGALTTYTEIRRSDLVARELPALVEAAATIGAAQIQNRGTIGGNVVNASPAGDTLPVLLATDAEIVLGSSSGERTIAAKDFWTGYRLTERRADELALRIRIPLPRGREVRFRKVGTRRAQAISKVVMAISWRPDAGVWRDVRVALGSVAATPIRATETERVLEGAAARKETADHAVATITAEINPIDDVRSTAEYRKFVTGRILHRLLRDAGGW